eukprot:GHVU01176619.1.p1 GENE.GHVU01176619.1~~GHVU01176619.1.p1  ORF type:complete len:291 (+),score=14.71 GHVU01176619.1:130-1002(+)
MTGVHGRRLLGIAGVIVGSLLLSNDRIWYAQGRSQAKEFHHDDDECKPRVDDNTRHSVVAYGSLLSADSRRRHCKSGTVLPIFLSGYSRSFSAVKAIHRRPYQPMYLGVSPIGGNDHIGINAGLVAGISADDVRRLDKRERGYCRLPVTPSSITVLSDIPVGADGQAKGGDSGSTLFEKVKNNPMWIYVPKKPIGPSSLNPVSKRYFCLFMSGCASVLGGAKLGPKRCLDTTSEWKVAFLTEKNETGKELLGSAIKGDEPCNYCECSDAMSRSLPQTHPTSQQWWSTRLR